MQNRSRVLYVVTVKYSLHISAHPVVSSCALFILLLFEKILVTMMMIVDLYSALRGAPLLRYVSRCIVKRKNGSRRWSGSRFQTIGPATENARRPNLLVVLWIVLSYHETTFAVLCWRRIIDFWLIAGVNDFWMSFRINMGKLSA